MEAVVTVPFTGAPDGEIYPRGFNVGDKVSGDLARVAVEEGWAAVEGKKAATKAAKTLEA